MIMIDRKVGPVKRKANDQPKNATAQRDPSWFTMHTTAELIDGKSHTALLTVWYIVVK